MGEHEEAVLEAFLSTARVLMVQYSWTCWDLVIAIAKGRKP